MPACDVAARRENYAPPSPAASTNGLGGHSRPGSRHADLKVAGLDAGSAHLIAGTIDEDRCDACFI
jgi:hypothetical protein